MNGSKATLDSLPRVLKLRDGAKQKNQIHGRIISRCSIYSKLPDRQVHGNLPFGTMSQRQICDEEYDFKMSVII